ncbi:MAG: ATP-grasp domain-containing protein [Gemmatimonadetes bacterium]|nr:ATP-grasp domain-containing protein [Gemmatimonadota bacterium]
MTTASAERVLLLDGQTTQALACARSLGRAGATVLVASARRRPLASWSCYCERQIQLPDESIDSFAQLRQSAAMLGATLVLPLTERSCLLLNAERGEWQREGITVAAPDATTLEQAFDKAHTIRVAERCGIAVPTTRVPSALAECGDIAAELGLPCVVKGRFSSAWMGTHFLRDTGTSYVRTPEELEAAVLRHRQGEYWPVVQRFVPGRGKGIFTVSHGGRPLAWFAHERLRDVRPTGSGSSLRRAAALDPRLERPAERLLREMRWDGPAMVEFRDDGEHEPYLIEVNGRFWGSLQLAISAGVDFPQLWLSALRQKAAPVPQPYRTDVTLRWLWGDAKRLLYVMAGPPPGFPGAFPSRLQGLREVLGAQPPGTRSETWDPADPWPAVGEWVQGIGELLARRSGSDRDRGSAAVRRNRRLPHAFGRSGTSQPEVTTTPYRPGRIG